MKKMVIVQLFLILALRILALSCYDVQYTTNPNGTSPYTNQSVTVEAIVVAECFYTGTSSNNYGYMLGDAEGGPWSGLFIFDNVHHPQRGDLVQVTGFIQEYYNWTEMTSLTSYAVLSHNNPLPPFTAITTGQLNDQGEQWENVLVSVQNVEVTSLTNNYGEFSVNDGSGVASINDQCFPRPGYTWPGLSLGQTYHQIRGVVAESLSMYTINPRDTFDVMQVPITCDLGLNEVQVDFWQDMGEPISVTGTVHNNTDLASERFDLVYICNEVEVGRQSYPGLAADQSLNLSFSFNPVEPGYKNLWVELEIEGDQVPGNNHYLRYLIVRPDSAESHDIGAGDSLLRIPWDFFWKYSLYEAIYYPAEIGSSGIINGVSFFNQFETPYINLSLQLWIGETNLPDLASRWVSATELQPAFNDYIEFPVGANEIYVPFSLPYNYGGGNLVIMAYQEHSWYELGNDKFQAQIMDGARARKRFTDAYEPDPNNPPAGIEPNGEVPRIRLYFEPGSAGEDPVQTPVPVLTNYPNPIRDRALFKTGLPGASLEIFNLRGQRVACMNLENGEAAWEARDEAGRRLAAGIYLARLKSGRASHISKLILLGE